MGAFVRIRADHSINIRMGVPIMTEYVGDFDELIDDLIDDGEVMVVATERGIGISARLGELTTLESPDGTIDRLFIEFFAESTVPGMPADLIAGYTEDDVTTITGVVVADVESDVYPPSYVGEALTVEKFLEEYEVGPGVTRTINKLMEQLVIQSTPSEGWLDQVSSLYHDRIPGRTSIEKVRPVN